MIRRLRQFFAAPFQLVLVISFSLIAAISIAIGVWAISRTISEYLSEAMNERVARDMQLAQTFYNLKLHEIESAASRLSKDPLVIEHIQMLPAERETVRDTLNQQIANYLSTPEFGGNHVIAVLDQNGNMLAGQLLTADEQLQPIDSTGNWHNLAVVQEALTLSLIHI
jgi:nitrogen fixation/metabolism regulation signal transduction histidine kinase